MPADPIDQGPSQAGLPLDPRSGSDAAGGHDLGADPREAARWDRPGTHDDGTGRRTVGMPTGPADEAPTEPAPVAAEDPTVTEGLAPATLSSRSAESRPSGRRGRYLRRAAGAVGLVALVAVVFTAGVGADRSGALGGPAAQPAAEDPAQFAIVRQAWDLLRTQYVRADTVDPTKMAYGAITGMTQAIGDTGHTTFMTPADRKASAAALSGTYVGIGVELDVNDSGVPVVNGVIHGGPSEAAGILPGDEIVAVDGKPTRNVPLETIASEVRGTTGTSVTLTIARPGTSTPLTFKIVRTEITVPPVDSAMVPGTSIGMIRVEQFSSGAGDQFATQLKALLAKHPTGLILDLRGIRAAT